MTKGEKETLISEVQCAAGFFAELQKGESVHAMNEAFAKCLMRAVCDWIEKTYDNPKDIMNELVECLIGKDTVTLFLESQWGSGKND